MKLLTSKQLAEIIKYTTKIVTTYTDLGVAIPNDLERIVKLLDHITALEAESASLMLAIDNGQEWSDCDEAALIVKLQLAEATITTLEAESDRKQAKIDALMLEYCPDEITDKQMEEWGEAQVENKQEQES